MGYFAEMDICRSVKVGIDVVTLDVCARVKQFGDRHEMDMYLSVYKELNFNSAESLLINPDLDAFNWESCILQQY